MKVQPFARSAARYLLEPLRPPRSLSKPSAPYQRIYCGMTVRGSGERNSLLPNFSQRTATKVHRIRQRSVHSDCKKPRVSLAPLFP